MHTYHVFFLVLRRSGIPVEKSWDLAKSLTVCWLFEEVLRSPGLRSVGFGRNCSPWLGEIITLLLNDYC